MIRRRSLIQLAIASFAPRLPAMTPPKELLPLQIGECVNVQLMSAQEWNALNSYSRVMRMAAAERCAAAVDAMFCAFVAADAPAMRVATGETKWLPLVTYIDPRRERSSGRRPTVSASCSPDGGMYCEAMAREMSMPSLFDLAEEEEADGVH